MIPIKGSSNRVSSVIFFTCTYTHFNVKILYHLASYNNNDLRIKTYPHVPVLMHFLLLTLTPPPHETEQEDHVPQSVHSGPEGNPVGRTCVFGYLSAGRPGAGEEFKIKPNNILKESFLNTMGHLI